MTFSTLEQLLQHKIANILLLNILRITWNQRVDFLVGTFIHFIILWWRFRSPEDNIFICVNMIVTNRSICRVGAKQPGLGQSPDLLIGSHNVTHTICSKHTQTHKHCCSQKLYLFSRVWIVNFFLVLFLKS